MARVSPAVTLGMSKSKPARGKPPLEPLPVQDVSVGVPEAKAEIPTHPVDHDDEPSQKQATPEDVVTWPELVSLDGLRDIQKRRANGERLPLRDKRLIIEILKHYVALSEEHIEAAIKQSDCAGPREKS